MTGFLQPMGTKTRGRGPLQIADTSNRRALCALSGHGCAQASCRANSVYGSWGTLNADQTLDHSTIFIQIFDHITIIIQIFDHSTIIMYVRCTNSTCSCFLKEPFCFRNMCGQMSWWHNISRIFFIIIQVWEGGVAVEMDAARGIK